VRIERVPDTVQTDHVDWEFRFSPMYDIDYRWTTAHRMKFSKKYFLSLRPIDSNSLIISTPIPIVIFRVFCYCRTSSTARVPKPLETIQAS